MADKSKKDWKKVFMGVFLTLVMMGSLGMGIFGMNSGQSKNAPEYNGHEFEVADDRSYLSTEIEEKEMKFHYFPGNLEYIQMSSTAEERIGEAEVLTFVFTPEDGGVRYLDVGRYFLDQAGESNVLFGVTHNTSEYELPVVDCSESRPKSPVFVFNQSFDPPEFVEGDSCYYLNGDSKKYLALLDRVLYEYYGVM